MANNFQHVIQQQQQQQQKISSLQHASCMCLYVCAKTAWLWLIYSNDHFNSIKCDSHKSPIPTIP